MITMHMIGCAHLDPVWLWNWQEGFQENKATFRSALDRMKEFDDFIFTSSSAQFYEWIEENDPAMFEEIRQRIHEGRWILCGGWWVQPDCNIPSGESFARQALIAQNYFLKKFGVMAKTGYCVDSFGHNAMLPQLLKKSGMDQYVYMRPSSEEKPDLTVHSFIWEAPDGSQVTAFRIKDCYCNWENLDQAIEDAAEDNRNNIDEMMCFYGVGNHGGGPTIENIQTIQKLQKESKNIEIVFSNPDRFFSRLDITKLPVVRGELQYHSPGCYSAVSMIKQKNRETENALLTAEKYSVLSDMLHCPGDVSMLTHAWKDLLFNQFHDTLAGSAIESAYEEARNQLGEALTIAHRSTNDSLNKISFRINIPLEPDHYPMLVFNPHSFEVSVPVEFEGAAFGDGIPLDKVKIVDSAGNGIPYQYVAPACRVPGRHRATFIASVPALGYALFYAEPNSPEEHILEAINNHEGTVEIGAANNSDGLANAKTAKAEELETEYASPFILENTFLKVGFNRETGCISSIYDKKNNREVLEEDSSACVIDDARNDTWGHSLKRLDQVMGRFELISAVVEDSGPVRKAVRMVSHYGNSTLVQTFALYTNEDKIHVHVRVNWQEHLKAFKLYFPTMLEDDAIAETAIPFGSISKEKAGREETMQEWADISDSAYGLSLINDAKYSVDFTANRIGLTVLRSPVFAHHQPYPLQDDEIYSYIDQGISEFNYLIKPHAGTWKEAGTVQDAFGLNQPVTTMFETFHKGDLPPVYQGIHIDQKNVILSALKKPLSGNGTVLRIYEAYGEEKDVAISISGHEYKTHLGPHEVKTFRFDEETFAEQNLIER